MILLLWLFIWWCVAVAALAALNFAVARLIERLVPPIGGMIEIGGRRLHVVDSGEKPGQAQPPIVFVHGLLGQLNHFSYALAQRFPERRVVLIDRPGAGYSQAGASQSLATQGAAVAGVIDALGLQKPLVVGHSLGGAVSLALALDHPEKLSGLALVAPLTMPVTHAPKPFENLATTSPLARWFGGWTIGPALSFLNSAAALRIVFGPETAPLDFWNRAGGILSARPSALIAASRDIAEDPGALWTQSKRYASLSVPVAILYADKDQILDPKTHGEGFLQVAPQAELKMIAGGHMLPITQPDAVESFIRSRLPSNLA